MGGKVKKSSMSKKAGRDESFFEATSLHGLKYINKSGTQRLLWIVVLILSILATYFFFKGTLEEYFGDNMKVLINSTNTPLTRDHFPVVTFCNMNLVSKTLQKQNPNKTIQTFQDAKELAQPCDKLAKACILDNGPCNLVQVLTDNGWCCQIDPRDTPPGMSPRVSIYMVADIQSYDYAYPSWFGEGLLVSVDPLDTYPDFFGKASFITPGTNNMLRLSLEKTSTTKTALSKSSSKRKCYTREEVPLEHFSSYSQSNCAIDKYINAVRDQCGCVGRHRGFNASTTEGVEECDLLGSMGWMFPLNYKQCEEKNTSLTAVLFSTGCPSQCMVNCEESRFSHELSTAVSPGFLALCGDSGNFYEQIACFFNTIGQCIGSKVCPSLELFKTGLDEDEMHFRKRKKYCTDTLMKSWEACGEKVNPGYFASPDLVQCLRDANSLDELLEMKDAMDLYGRENFVIVQVMFKGNYYTSIVRDVSYTFSSLVANVGGLLGLSMGCSMISIAELFILPLKNALCSKRRKHVEQVESST